MQGSLSQFCVKVSETIDPAVVLIVPLTPAGFRHVGEPPLLGTKLKGDDHVLEQFCN